MCRPGPVNLPVQAFQHILAQSVAITRRFRGVIGRAAALHAQHVIAFSVGMDYLDINPVFRYADLRMRVIAGGFQAREEPALEVALRLAAGRASRRDRTMRRVFPIRQGNKEEAVGPKPPVNMSRGGLRLSANSSRWGPNWVLCSLVVGSRAEPAAEFYQLRLAQALRRMDSTATS
jgi:hypothetical protein